MTEATIRRVASDVAKNYFRRRQQVWQDQRHAITKSLADQGELLDQFQQELSDQQKWWSELQANLSADQVDLKQQEAVLTDLRADLQNLQRDQTMQEAAMHDLEFRQHQKFQTEEKERLDNFFQGRDQDKISEFLSNLNLSTLTNAEVLQSNSSNIFIFPHAAARTDNSSIRFLYVKMYDIYYYGQSNFFV